MKLVLLLIAGALFACFISLGLWTFKFNALGLAANSQEWANFGSYIGGVLSPVLAFLSLIGLLLAFNTQRADSARLKAQSDDLNYFNHAVSSLERAYATLSIQTQASVDGKLQPVLEPRQERLAWLACARLLLSARDIASRISEHSEGLRALYAGEEEHWRHLFYKLFNADHVYLRTMNGNYFSGSQEFGSEQIEERSIRVVYEFKEWPEDKKDPIDEVPLFKESELAMMNGGMTGVKAYVLSRARFKSPQKDVRPS